MDIRQPNPTQAAGILRRFLQESGIDIKHTAALEAIARISGYTDSQAMVAHQRRQAERDADYPPLLQLDPQGDENCDFRYVGPDKKGAWVTLENISVYLKPTDEGVVVDLFAHRAEDLSPLASTWVEYQESLNTLCENEQVDEDDVAQWAARTHGLNDWSQVGWSRKTELVREFAAGEQQRLNATRYVHGEWDHHFSRKGAPDSVRFVWDQRLECLVAAQVQKRGSAAWRDASSLEMQDVEDSLKNGNEDALDKPGDFGLEASANLPQWAQHLVRAS